MDTPFCTVRFHRCLLIYGGDRLQRVLQSSKAMISKVVGPCLTNGQIRARTFSPILTFAVFGGLLRNSTFSRSFVPFHPFSLSSACRAVALAAPMMALLGGGHVALAQDAAQLSGTVIDPSGAVVPSAVVTVKNLGTNATGTSRRTRRDRTPCRVWHLANMR